MLTTFQECDMGNLIDLRAAHKDAFEQKHGVKLGFMSAFVLAATAALQEVVEAAEPLERGV
jgi:2-oxoglutarate dehydrogenase E2 component (dihydrolipoamide succinyltransferase)